MPVVAPAGTNGEAYKAVFDLIPTGIFKPPTIDYAQDVVNRCCFVLPVIADQFSSDKYKNDQTSVYFGYSSVVVSVVLKLMKDGEIVATLNTNALGTFYAFGFQDDGIKKYIGYQLDWKLILAAHGAGEYQVRSDYTDVTAATGSDYWFKQCLYQYTLGRVDETVRLEFYHNGIIGDWIADTDLRSFKDLNWYNSVRIPKAMIYNERAEFESEEKQYNNGKLQDVKMDQEPLFDLIVEPMPADLHRYMRVEVLTGDRIIVTDYNARSPLRPFVDKELKFRGNYEPNWQGIYGRSTVLIGFKQRFNNLRKRFC